VRNRRVWLAVAAVGVVAIAAAVIWFEPHKLFIDDKVNEASPVPRRNLQPPIPPRESAPPAPRLLGSGTFVAHEHSTTGKALVIQGVDGARTLRLEDLKTSNGPDLRVYLSSAAPDAGWHAFDDDYVELGKLKGNIGSQNYDISPNVDLARYSTAVVWCKRFSVSFGAAAVRPT
jgi:electron transfer DM13